MSLTGSDLRNDFKQLSIRYDKSHEVLWSFMDQKNLIPCFNSELINEVSEHQLEIEKTGGMICLADEINQIKYSVAASLTPDVFSLGGHLVLIHQLAKNKHRDALMSYATRSINALAHRINRFNVPSIITISLLQGQTLGAGLEVALTSDVVIAEKKTILSFPEIYFNMIPGMGGYSLVARKAGTKLADNMVLKGKQYTAEQAYELGLVDVLVEDGKGMHAVYDWIEDNKRISNGYLALQKTKQCYNPLTVEELMNITRVWVDAALSLSDRDFGIMERFIYTQEKQFLKTSAQINEAKLTNNIIALRG